MSMYGVGILPLIQTLQQVIIKQVWYADDATGGGLIQNVKDWWDLLKTAGPAYGYHPNAAKSWLVVKETLCERAKGCFEGTGIHITTEGRRLLGAVIGEKHYSDSYVEKAISSLTKQVSCLAEVARSQPHAAYIILTHGLANKWTFLLRTIHIHQEQLQPLESTIRNHLIPNITGRNSPGDQEKELLALPPRLGGLGIVNPTLTAQVEYEPLIRMTEPLVHKIINQEETLQDVISQVIQRKRRIHQHHRSVQNVSAAKLKSELPSHLSRAMELASEKGASSWLTALPLEKYGFVLHKGAFLDALCLQYGWQPQHLPSHCSCEQLCVAIQHYVITRLETSWQTSCEKCAMTSQWNLTYSK